MSRLGNRRRIKKDMDLISNLPDAILCHILSFLPTMLAVKTSILSKRWKYVWTQVPALDFTEATENLDYEIFDLEQSIRFKSFMDRVLLHNDASYVKRFWLDLCDTNVDSFYVNSWLNAAAKREIHDLDISLGMGLGICLLPRFLFSEKLVVFKLKGPIDISASVSLCLPNLKILHLNRIKFPNDDFMKRLSSNCPVLSELHIIQCSVTTTLCVESLTLKSLVIRTLVGFKQSCIIIKTLNLKYLYLDNCGSFYEHDVQNMSSLIEADIGIYYYDIEDYDDHSQKLLWKISRVETLCLRSKAYLHQSKLPVFGNLTSLEYELEANTLLSKLLNCAPKLKYLTLKSLIHEKRALIFCQQDRAILCRECDIPLHTSNEHTKKHNRFLLTGIKLSAMMMSKKVDASVVSSGNGCDTVPDFKSNRQSTPVFSENIPVTNSSNSTVSSETSQLNNCGGSTSNISEYLIDMLPGWHFEDLLVDSASPAPFGFPSKGGFEVNEDVLTFFDVENEKEMTCSSAQSENFWVPQAAAITTRSTTSSNHFSQPSELLFHHQNTIYGTKHQHQQDLTSVTTMKLSKKICTKDDAFTVPQINPLSVRPKRTRTLW